MPTTTISDFIGTVCRAGAVGSLALLLGPSAGRHLWHGDVLGSFEYKLGATDLTRAAWAVKGPSERRDILRECFRLDEAPAGSQALQLLAIVLGQPTAPRLYW